jgi:hypothetical protein
MNVILTDQNILDRLWCESKGGIPWMPRSLAVISCFDLEMVVTESEKNGEFTPGSAARRDELDPMGYAVLSLPNYSLDSTIA